MKKVKIDGVFIKKFEPILPTKIDELANFLFQSLRPSTHHSLRLLLLSNKIQIILGSRLKLLKIDDFKTLIF